MCVYVGVGVGGSIVIIALGWNETEEEAVKVPSSVSHRLGTTQTPDPWWLLLWV